MSSPLTPSAWSVQCDSYHEDSPSPKIPAPWRQPSGQLDITGQLQFLSKNLELRLSNLSLSIVFNYGDINLGNFDICCSVTKSCQLFVTPWIAACQASLSFTISQSLLKLISTESMMPFNHLILHYPLLLTSVFLSIRFFLNESVLCIRWPKYCSFNYSISPSNEYSGLISFRIDWFDLLAVQGTLKGLLQHHSSKASVLQHLAFFMVQLSHPYMTTGKTIFGLVFH